MASKEVMFLCIIGSFLKCYADFVVPEVILEAYTPKGFKASIPALNGIKFFAFHANLNKDIKQDDSGEFGGNFIQPTNNNEWSYYNKNVILKPRDTIHYWVFIQYEKLGYRFIDKWTVSELLDVDVDCEFSSSVVVNKSFICAGGVILEDHFDSAKINDSKWFMEQFIPSKGEDYEFVSYQNKRDICYTQAGKLFIKPKALQNDSEVKGELDLWTNCTRRRPAECYVQQQAFLILPPVTSGRMVSRVNFRYGKIEIKAKLPAGDWIYPQIYLEEISDPRQQLWFAYSGENGTRVRFRLPDRGLIYPKVYAEQIYDPTKKLWIAYSRGNIHLQTNSGDDIGGHLLYGGPVLHSSEPERSSYLRKKNNTSPFSSEMHTYTVIWQKDGISLRVDGREYGRINKTEMSKIKFAENNLARLVLGVGVGGVNDFPDDSGTGDSRKPWKNFEIKQMKKFFDARNKWSKSWDGDNTALQIEYIKITALIY